MGIDHSIYFRTAPQPVYDPAEDEQRQLQMQAQQAQIEGAAQDRQYRLAAMAQEHEQRQAQAQAQAQAATKKEHAKFFGQLASGIKDGAAWDAGIDQAIRLGYPDAEQFRGQFSPELRAAVMAAGGVEDKSQGDAFTLSPGSVRYGPDGKPIASSPYRPQIIKDDDGNIYEYGGDSSGGAGGGAATALRTNGGALKDGPFARSQPGYTGNSGGFATFDSPESGVKAQEQLLRTRYLGRGLNTIDKIIDTYAPQGSENSAESVANYKAYIAQRTGIDISQPLTPQDIPRVAAAQREFETGNRPTGGGPRLLVKGNGPKPSAESKSPPKYQRGPNGQIMKWVP